MHLSWILTGATMAVSMAAAIQDNALTSLVPPLTSQEITYLKGDPVITHKVTFEVSQRKEDGNKILGELSLGLFGTVTPNTAKNFAHLANMTYGYGYDQVKFHRVIKNFMIQGGDFERGTGTGGHSIFDGPFKDENFDIKHDKLGRLSMANSGPNTNGAQFFITNVETLSHLDGKHVVFGQLIGGFDVLHKISSVDVEKPLMRPEEEVFISKTLVTVFANSYEPPNSDTPVYEEVVVQSRGYGYLVFFLLVVCGLFYYNRWYHKRQYVTDIKDPAFF